jgi:6-phosphogluconolactonase
MDQGIDRILARKRRAGHRQVGPRRDQPGAAGQRLAGRAQALDQRQREIAARRVAANGDVVGRPFTLALPGGSVATTCFPRLAKLPIDWDRCEFFWVDERAVPPSDPESNYGTARSLWLDAAGVPATRAHRMPADAPDLDAAAESYSDVIIRIAHRPPRLNYVILGVGPDGHVASLFPGHALLAEAHRLAAAVRDAPKPPAHRLTLTLPVLSGAGRVVLAAFGRTKAEVIREALTNPASALPVSLVLRRAERPLILLDRDAASLVS